ncbi:hypothetical protein RDV78_00040 [Bacillota bacterium LX-D]|nr:hypothetical protein [Bacillota bacterium LX-D]
MSGLNRIACLQDRKDEVPNQELARELAATENLAENVKWDEDGKFDKVIDLFLSFCDDQKPITVRQCKVNPYEKHLCTKIADKLIYIKIMERRETQRKILLLDIQNVLIAINKQSRREEIEMYISNTMTG